MLRKLTPFVLSAVLALAGLALPVHAGPVMDRVKAAGKVRVCIWPDYYGISYRDPRTQQLQGIDVDMAQHLAKDLKVALKFVNSSFATLIDDLIQDRCDVAMFAIGITPARSEKPNSY
jgi:ABC-type amino acid transport substrate-binding protein